jgi:hypothetical protein
MEFYCCDRDHLHYWRWANGQDVSLMRGRVPDYAANIVRREYRRLRRAGMTTADARQTVWAILLAGRNFQIQYTTSTNWQ